MTWTPERSTINQRVQVGPEATTALGTPVAAGKLLECFDWVFGITPDITEYTPTGHKYVTEQEENMEWVDGTLSGWMDYNGLAYILGGAMGSVAPALHSPSTTAYDWVFTPPTTGSIVPQTLTIQQGDAVRAHSFAYGLFTQVGYKVTRKATTTSAKLIGQPLSDGITLTASPTAVALAPIVGKQVNVYLDTTSAGLGTTQLTRFLEIDFTFDGIYGPSWFLNRSTVGFTAHVDLKPKCTVKLKVEANAQGMGLLADMQAGTTFYLRVDAQGAEIDVPNSVFQEFKHDMAIKIGKPSTFSDDAGIFAIEWECTVIEDPTWGKAQTLTLTNLLSTL